MNLIPHRDLTRAEQAVIRTLLILFMISLAMKF
jgi:hypothetical protein